MDDLILRALQGDVSHDEELILAAWRAESSVNEQRYQHLARLSAALEQLADRRAPLRPAATDIIAEHGRRTPAVRRPVPGWIKAAGLAAALVLAFAGGFLTQPREDTTLPVPAEITTGDGERTTTRLPDGSIVRLAERSRLVLTGGTAKREVWLEGTGYFAIAKHPGRTFTVNSPNGSATVLGTRFEMRTTDRDLRVVVVEGKVAVHRGEDRVEVSAGEMTTLSADAPASVVKVERPRRLVGWMGRTMLFQDSPLGSVMREIEEQYGIRAVFTDSTLTAHLVSASFTEQPAGHVISVVCQVVNAQCALGNGVVTIAPK